MQDVKITDEWLSEQDKLFRLELIARLIKYEVEHTKLNAEIRPLTIAGKEIRSALLLESKRYRAK